MIYIVYKKLIYKRISHSRSELIEEEIGGDRRKCGIITLIKSNINACMSSSSTNGSEQHTITVKTLEREILLGTYYCNNNVNLELHNIHT